jgi:hypothetical protein
MVKRTAAGVAAGLAFFAAAAFIAPAQSLQRLTVESFDLAADTASPKVDVPFHLILTLRLREHVPQVDNLNLPILAALELLGDERETIGGPRGTQYRETIAVVAHDAGAIAISPATLQAIDARDGKPKEWYSNALTLRVAAAGSHIVSNGAQVLLATALAAMRVLLWLLVWLLAVGCIAIVVIVLVRGRKRTAADVLPPPPPVRAIVERSHREQAEDALTVLRAERTRSAAVAVRSAIWRMVGASDGETLGDVLRRPDASDATTRELLIALERSAFTYDDDLSAAIEDACAALERYVGAAA